MNGLKKVAEVYNERRNAAPSLFPPVMMKSSVSPRQFAACANRRGRLGDGTVVDRHVSLNWTTAQKADPKTFRPGQLLGFHRAVWGIAKNETMKVIHVDTNRIVVPGVGGERAFTGKQAKCFEVLERRQIEVAPRDRLLLMVNRREAGFRTTNGEIVTASQIEPGERIQLEDGRTLLTTSNSSPTAMP